MQQYRCGCLEEYPTKRSVKPHCPQHLRDRQGPAIPVPQTEDSARTPTLAESLKAEMLETGAKLAWAGHPDLMLSAYGRTNGRVMHPMNRIKAVVNAARQSPLFEKLRIRATDSAGRREILHPAFRLRPESSSTENADDQ